ncbi:MAG: hypothetical protein QM808_05250 [Steroidobacteraceae bacterium]
MEHRRNLLIPIGEHIPHVMVARLFAEFEQLVGSKYWIRRVNNIEKTIQQHPLAGHRLYRENEFAVSLTKFSQQQESFGILPAVDTTVFSDVKAMHTIVGFLHAYRGGDGKLKEKLLSRLIGDFQTPDDLRAFQMEMFVAANFLRRGYKVAFADMTDLGRFDLLVSSHDGEFEVECKSISPTIGRPVDDAAEDALYSRVKKGIEPLLDGLPMGIVVKVTLKEAIPSDNILQKALAQKIIDAVRDRIEINTTDLVIRLTDFGLCTRGLLAGMAMPLDAQLEVIMKMIKGLNKIPDDQAVLVLDNQDGRLIVVTVEVALPVTSVFQIFDRLNKGRKRQLSGKQAGILYAQLEGFSWEEFNKTFHPEMDMSGQLQRTEFGVEIRGASVQYLNKRKAEKLSGIIFLSRADRELRTAKPCYYGSGSFGVITKLGAINNRAFERAFFTQP